MDLKKIVEAKYAQLWNESKIAIQNNEIELDPYLAGNKSDVRRGFSVIIPIAGNCLENFSNIIRQLKKLEPGQYAYPLTDLHLTVLDYWVVAPENFVLDKNQVDSYDSILDSALQDFPLFQVRFLGLTASRTAVLVKGFGGTKLKELRESLRTEIQNKGFKLNERYKREGAHVSILRFMEKLRNPRVFADRIQELQSRDFGILQVQKIQFVFHDWYNSRKKTKILSEYVIQ